MTFDPPAAAEPEDAALLHAAKRDLRAFAPFYERYFARVYAYCLRRTGDHHEAEDLASQIFTQAMLRVGSYRGGVAVAWLFQIAHNTTVNALKARRPNGEWPPDLADPSPPPIEQVIRSEEQRRLLALVAALPADQQNLLLLREVAGLSAEEIGRIVGKRPGAVRTALHRILKHLQAKFEDEP